MGKTKIAKREKEIDVMCCSCGSIFKGFRQKENSRCDLCWKAYYKEKRDAKRKVDKYKSLKVWMRALIGSNLKISGEERELIVNQMLQKLVDQNFKCYYTSLPLVPGLNASIEHIMPKSKKPELRKEIDNLVWVRREINAMKNNYGFNEFIDFCKLCVNSPVLLQLAQNENRESEIVQYEDYVI